MNLELDATCAYERAYRTDLPAGSDVGVLVERLEARSWQVLRASHGVVELQSPAHHRVVVVPATLRVQIRVDLGVEHAARRREAERIFAELVRVITGRP